MGNESGGQSSGRGGTATRSRDTSLHRLEEILSGMDTAVAAIDREWRCIYVNDHALGYARRQREEVLGRTIWEIAPELAGTRYETEYRRVLEERKAVRFEAWTGSSGRCYGIYAYPIEEGFVIQGTDISERRKNEEALQESKRRYSALFNAKSNGIVHWKVITDERGKPVDLKMLQANNAFEKIIGLQKEQVEGKLLTEIFPGIERMPKDYIGKYGDIALHGGELVWEDYFEPAHTWVSNYAYSPLPGEVTMIFSDITGRKKAELALAESQGILDSFFRNSLVIMNVHDSSFRYLKINAATEKYLGRPAKDIVGRPLSEIAPGFAEVLKGPFEAVLRTGASQAGIEVKGGAPAQSGKTDHFLLNCFPVPLPAGERGIGVVAVDITRLKEAEKELQNTAARFRRIFNSKIMGVVIADFRRNVLEANDYYLDLVEYTRKDFEKQKIRLDEITPQEYRVRDYEAMKELKERGVCAPYEKEYETKSGRRKWVNVSDVLWPGDEPKIIAIIIDITERKRIEQELVDAKNIAEKRAAEAEEGERTLVTLMDNVPEGIFIADPPDGRIRMVSKFMSDITGIPKAELTGIPDEDIRAKLRLQGSASPPGRQQLPLIRAITRGDVVTDEEWVIHPQGREPVTVLINARPIRGADAAITGAVSSWRDITERKKAEDTLRRNEYELRTLVDNSPDIIFRVNRRLQYTYVNPAYERITGIMKDHFVGRTNDQLGMPEETVVLWRSALQEVLDGGRERSLEFEMKSFFGRRYFYARLIPEFERSGLVETVLIIARDITERKRTEEQIRYISFHDKVTGLFNRTFFEEEVRRVDTERALPISIIMGDVNNLKLTNDVFGHDEGDKLLKAIAASIREACRQSDIVARWGGDEFAVILPGTDFITAERAAARIGQIAAEHKGTVLRPSIAVGAAVKEQREQNIYQIIRRAEERMYDHKLAHSRENQEMTLGCLTARAGDLKREHAAHIERSRQLARRFGVALGLSEDQLQDLSLLVDLHDIGDVAVPQEIVTKPGRLNGDEWRIMKKRSEAGLRIVKTYADTARISDEILSQGENWDGSGYPRGLKGAGIPYLSRIFRIVDAYDVMTHPHPYARSLTGEEAVEELQRNAGKQFDPELIPVFVTRVLQKAPAMAVP